ncbi:MULTISPECIES: restriction endonuclease subunit S [Flavobacterium]|uniref:Restriction endonuclease subunit S n=1 Tax=Flavobacterium jumunjinense TaxID=998845 RepID=A0ABV5GK00_9FLAO|nr:MULTISPECIES: restriction endonuclease subunit S [Flavobacterium]
MMKKYQHYKNSGVAWLGEIPEHWEIIKGKWLFTKMERPIRKEDDIVTCFRDGEVTLRKNRKIDGFTNALKEHGYQGIRKGDLVIHNMDAFAGAIGISDSDGKSTPVYSVCTHRIENKVNSYFYTYFLRNLAKLGFIESLAKGIRERSSDFRFNDFGKLELPVPPLEEQTAIANFLDDKTTKIDQAIAIKQQQIELLKERRQILIHKAVTRGLNENVKLKDSGVEWIGEIPEHWEVKKLIGLCRFVRGNSTFSKDELLNDGQYVALQYGKTYKVNEVDKNYNFYVNDEFYKETQIVNYGDTIFISTSETIEDLGHSAFYNRNDLGLLGGEQLILKPYNEKINCHYLYFSSKVFSKELRKYATGIKVFRFNINDLKTIYTATPPLKEQKEIAEFIEIATTKIATAISLKQKEIEKLKEYKMSLIDGVVTGKVRVC